MNDDELPSRRRRGRRQSVLRRYNSYPGKDSTGCIKCLLFASNSLFWLAGLAVMMVGMYAWVEKDTFRNIGKLVSQRALFFDPAFLFVVGGCFIFTISFLGCFGALKESECCLMLYALILATLFVAQMAVAIYSIVNRGATGDLLRSRLFDLIDHYREDGDLRGLIDWVQRDWLACCGVDSFRDWHRNAHFRCGKVPKGPDACSVPASCCGVNATTSRVLLCGRGALLPEADLNGINIDGCLQRAYVWIVRHSSRLALVAACLLLIQVIGLALALALRSRIADKRMWEKIGMLDEDPAK